MSQHDILISSHQDDSDITIIHPSIVDDDPNIYVNNTQTASFHSMTTPPGNRCGNDFVFVDHNPQENAKKIEQVLDYYLRDLRQESKSQLECSQQLVTRLMDLIRPAYPNDQHKMIELDAIMRDIANFHDKRHVENEGKIQELQAEIRRLEKTLILSKDELLMHQNSSLSLSTMTSIREQRPSIHDYEQWTEIEDDAKKLQELVQTQKNQINEIVSLISQSATMSNSLDLPTATENNSEDSSADNPTTPVAGKISFSSLLKKIKCIAGHQTQPELTPAEPLQETMLENHSPGVSPTQSLATLTLTSLQTNEQPGVSNLHVEEPIPELPAQTIEPPSPTVETKELKKCPICSVVFEATITDVEMYDHIDKCLFPSMAKVEPTLYECPECSRKWPSDDEQAYHQHLSDCFNRDI
ncbi:unnamed protein product [Adineta ricciae]|uniref:Uncharacterized protein n=1 Tax=Adineta ricciae TaxID=249248 RepID=A0A815GC92_ADIRI|nr:unnamed protein product [Adineta ricciae]